MTQEEKNPICCICGKECDDKYGHNPWPLSESGRCCTECNAKVVAARFERIAAYRFEVMRVVEDPTVLSGSRLVPLEKTVTLDQAREIMMEDYEANRDLPQYIGTQITDIKTTRRVQFILKEEEER